MSKRSNFHYFSEHDGSASVLPTNNNWCSSFRNSPKGNATEEALIGGIFEGSGPAGKFDRVANALPANESFGHIREEWEVDAEPVQRSHKRVASNSGIMGMSRIAGALRGSLSGKDRRAKN